MEYFTLDQARMLIGRQVTISQDIRHFTTPYFLAKIGQTVTVTSICVDPDDTQPIVYASRTGSDQFEIYPHQITLDTQITSAH